MDKIELAPYTSQSAENLALKCTPTPREEFPPRCAINSTITNCESVAKQCQSTWACARYNARKVNTTCLIFRLCLFCLAIIALTVLGWTIYGICQAARWTWHDYAVNASAQTTAPLQLAASQATQPARKKLRAMQLPPRNGRSQCERKSLAFTRKKKERIQNQNPHIS